MHKIFYNKKIYFLFFLIMAAIILITSHYLMKPKSYILQLPFKQEFKLSKGQYSILYNSSSSNINKLKPSDITIRKVDTTAKKTGISKTVYKDTLTSIIHKGKNWSWLCSFDITEKGSYEITGYLEKNKDDKVNILILQ